MKKINVLFGVVAVLLVVGLISYNVYLSRRASSQTFSYVYLSNGEMYVGKLYSFPKFELRNAYLMAVIKNPTDPSKNTFQLSPVKGSIWSSPSLYINKKQVVYYGPLEDTSQVAVALKGAIK